MAGLASGWLSVFTNFSKIHYPPTFCFSEGPWEDSNPSLRMATRESSHFLQKKTVLPHSLKVYSPPKASTELPSTLMHTQRWIFPFVRDHNWITISFSFWHCSEWVKSYCFSLLEHNKQELNSLKTAFFFCQTPAEHLFKI